MARQRLAERWEYLPEARRRRALNERLRRLMAGELSPLIHGRLRAGGLEPSALRRVEDLRLLPVLHKHDLTGEGGPTLGGRLGVPLSQLRRIFVSPGPIYEPQDDRDDFWGWSLALHAAGFQPGDLILICFSYHLTPAGMMFDDGARAIGCVTIPGGVGNQQQQITLLADLPVAGYIGLPSYLYNLLERAEAEGQALSLQRALVSAEPLPPSLRAALEHRGIHVRQCYGTADIGCIAYECRQADGLHLRPDLIIEICDPESGSPVEPGQPGEVVVSLLDPAYPLLRFGTGDMSAIRYEPCTCGRTTPRLVGILGRTAEGIKVRGLFVYPEQIREALEGVAGVERGQGVVRRKQHRDELEVQVVLAPGASAEATVETLRRRLQDILKLRADVMIVEAETLPAGAPLLSDLRSWD